MGTAPLHADYVAGTLLTHLQGRKRLWLYPATQQHILHLTEPAEYYGWGALSASSPADDARLANATPIVLELAEGETLFIPCGWAHRAEYLEPSLAVSCTVLLNWLDELL